MDCHIQVHVLVHRYHNIYKYFICTQKFAKKSLRDYREGTHVSQSFTTHTLMNTCWSCGLTIRGELWAYHLRVSVTDRIGEESREEVGLGGWEVGLGGREVPLRK